MTHVPLLLAMLLVACGSVGAPSEASQNRSAATATAPLTWDARGCGDDAYQNTQMQRHPKLMGLAPETLMTAYGKPSGEERFVVGKPVGTFYVGLGRMPHARKHPDTGKPARVIIWTKAGCSFHVFFIERGGKWQAVEAFEARPGADY